MSDVRATGAGGHGTAGPVAPVSASAEIAIGASRDVVWRTLVGFDRWPEWNADVAWVQLDRPVAPGSTFRWKSGPGSIRARVVELDPPGHLVLSGTTFGIRAAHDWLVDRGAEGGTLVRTTESWDGLLARLLRGPLQARLERRLAHRLASLKAEAERLSAGAREAPSA